MNLTIEQAALNKALARATSVVERRNTIPILSNVLIEAAGGEVWLTATDLDIETRVRVEAQVAEEGAVTVAATLLSDIVRNAPEGAEIALSKGADDPRLIVRFGRSRYQAPILPACDFPKRKEAGAGTTLAVDAPMLLQMFARVGFAMSTEETRYYLCGTFLHTVAERGDSVLRMAATCGGRLAMAQNRTIAENPSFSGVIVPRKTVGEFSRLLAGHVGQVDLFVSPGEVALSTGEAVIRSKVIDGAYPDYVRVIPSKWTHEIAIDRALLAAAVRRVALIDTGKVRAVKLIAENNVLTLQARSMEAGQATEEIEVGGTTDRFEVAFNARFLLDAIDQTEAEEVVLRANGEDRGGPCRLELPDADPEAGDVLAILMPMAV